ncbi:hypothetical protein BGX38DRAFT_819457 [Terfezia claveryi]|nr:hypothetical protein BGX38DRAFT_819457 [Terfezia claveryi]
MMSISTDTTRSPTPSNDKPASNSPTAKVCEIKFDELGDIMLVIASQPGTARFQVNSSVLCLASPVFRVMLGPGSSFKEAADLAANNRNRTNPLTIPLEDDANALAVILRILHLQFNWLPPIKSAIDEEQLYNMAIICDKYEMQQALGYWFQRWKLSIIQANKDSRISSTMKPNIRGLRWLFMAYAFADHDLFKFISKDIILNSQVTTSDDLEICGIPNGSSNLFMPQAIKDALLAARLQAIEVLLDCVHNAIERYSSITSGLNCHFRHEGCDALYLGLLIREFKRLNVYPVSSAVLAGSVSLLKTLLDGVKFSSQYLLNELPGGCCGDPQMPFCHPNWDTCRNCVRCFNCKLRCKIEGLQLSNFTCRTTPQVAVLGNLWKPVEYA